MMHLVPYAIWVILIAAAVCFYGWKAGLTSVGVIIALGFIYVLVVDLSPEHGKKYFLALLIALFPVSAGYGKRLG